MTRYRIPMRPGTSAGARRHVARSAIAWALRLLSAVLVLLVAACSNSSINPLANFVPETVPSETDFARIAEFAGYAQAAYRSEAEIRRRYPDTVRIVAPQGTSTLYFLEISPENRTQTVSVRGTKTLGDKLRDVEFVLVPDRGADVSFHRGFKADARRIYADLKPHLKRDYRTRVTGHSLGAAVSAILMIYLQRDGYVVEPSVNFGQPKFTNAAGAELYQDLPIQRIVNANDIVPMLPPAFLRHPRHGPYAHVGEEIILLDGPSFVFLDTHDAERISVDEFWRERDFASRADHRMPLYVERIQSKQGPTRQLSYAEWRARSTE